jgi:acetyl/propionyl-CoA carboxylase alpha subunit
VEFLVDVSDPAAGAPPFYFLEMNTRLQVEHPVTEEVVGVDLVRAQLQVADGHPLPWSQSSLTQRGHAIEARLYAEDPSNGFLPQAGRLLLYREPRLPGVRVDAGVSEGDEISVHYDALIAKVVARAETREGAIGRLAEALKSFPVLGVATNASYLLNVLAHPRFKDGTLDTTVLDTAVGLAAASAEGEVPPVVRAVWEAIPAISAPGGAGAAAPADPWSTIRNWRR